MAKKTTIDIPSGIEIPERPQINFQVDDQLYVRWRTFKPEWGDKRVIAANAVNRSLKEISDNNSESLKQANLYSKQRLNPAGELGIVGIIRKPLEHDFYDFIGSSAAVSIRADFEDFIYVGRHFEILRMRMMQVDMKTTIFVTLSSENGYYGADKYLVEAIRNFIFRAILGDVNQIAISDDFRILGIKFRHHMLPPFLITNDGACVVTPDDHFRVTGALECEGELFGTYMETVNITKEYEAKIDFSPMIYGREPVVLRD